VPGPESNITVIFQDTAQTYDKPPFEVASDTKSTTVVGRRGVASYVPHEEPFTATITEPRWTTSVTKMWRYNSITMTSSDLRRDEGEQATVLRDFANHPLSTGVVQSTVIYYFFCDPFGGNLSVVWSLRGRPWCSGWEAHKKILRTATPQ